MNILDFILLTIMAVAMVRGIMRGMIRQLASLIGILVGFVVAGHVYSLILPLLKKYLSSIPHLEILSYLAVFFATWLIVTLLGLLALRLSRAMLMGWIDRILGGALGLVKGTVGAVVLVAVLTLFLPGKSSILTGSLLSAHAQKAGSYLIKLTPKDLRHRYQKRHEELLDHLKQEHLIRGIKKKLKR
jgi:membrane protein required for colicin V production